MNESCYYDLAIDYQFTFNLSKPEDKHYTAINFKNIPTKADVDVDFQISCSVPAKVSWSNNSTRKWQTIMISFLWKLNKLCDWILDEPDISDGERRQRCKGHGTYREKLYHV